MLKKSAKSHGWLIGAGHVRHKQPTSKYLENLVFVVCENLVFVVCENHSTNFAKNDIKIFFSF